jgi:hypothetical protein
MRQSNGAVCCLCDDVKRKRATMIVQVHGDVKKCIQKSLVSEQSESYKQIHNKIVVLWE